MQQRQRVGDLEEELESLQKQLRSTQTKVIEQVKEIFSQKTKNYLSLLVTRNWKFKSNERCF